jgi:hypothetical protein
MGNDKDLDSDPNPEARRRQPTVADRDRYFETQTSGR